MRNSRAALLAAAMTAVLLPAVLMPTAANADKPEAPEPVAELLASGLGGSIGSTIGPDGALYVAARENGEIIRVDTVTGASTTYASGLPTHPFGGVFDVAFLGDTAYALVTTVGPDVGGSAVGGIYRIDDADSSTLVADLATWSTDNPPTTSFDVPSGVQFAFEVFGNGFLVTDGHHNRLLFVDLSGNVTQVAQFDNIVPTGLEVDGSKVYMGEAGPIPHDPADGKVVVGHPHHPVPREVASGYSLIVDVEAASCGLYALSQGDSPGEVPAGSPALPESGELLRVNGDGTFTVIVDGLDLPTSLSFVGDTAFIVTLEGDVLTVDDVAPDRHGMWGGCGGNPQG
ncbi:ScyD/ScyE family protein [Agromyces sp. Soil535]|uniref:ScyD/ScyE family protein n=1 Tax=Agromyces sp. Soil535 TaxID=1736390 RepID=UPI0007018A06|nr:ScyD/ScyE family protein [Agromyces sp. Soil535]KRE28919.1 hypothetical protein ASG80_20845 [Agromyces sp. Soil535]